MFADTLLITGSVFVLILALGQLLIQRKRSANRWLCALFSVSFLWIAHAASYRLGVLEHLPHLNKIYLPLLCLTGSFWYSYVRSLYDSAADERYDRRHLIPTLACLLLSIPFFAQDADFKRHYVEVNVTDMPTMTMYAATRLAELTLAGFLLKTLVFLNHVGSGSEQVVKARISHFLWLFTVTGLTAAVVRLLGSVVGSDAVSVVVPSLLVVSVFVGMHFLSYRIPTVLSLDHASRTIRTRPDGVETLADYRDRLRKERWFLDPNLKLQALARKLGTPPNELSAVINTVAGMNFNEFINEFRIDHAKTFLLTNPEMSILEVALASGFNAKTTFNAHFKTQTLVTPTQFRNRANESRLEETGRQDSTPHEKFGSRNMNDSMLLPDQSIERS